MHELGEKDRAAIVLRFFENLSLKQVGMQLWSQRKRRQDAWIEHWKGSTSYLQTRNHVRQIQAGGCSGGWCVSGRACRSGGQYHNHGDHGTYRGHGYYDKFWASQIYCGYKVMDAFVGAAVFFVLGEQ